MKRWQVEFLPLVKLAVIEDRLPVLFSDAVVSLTETLRLPDDTDFSDLPRRMSLAIFDLAAMIDHPVAVARTKEGFPADGMEDAPEIEFYDPPNWPGPDEEDFDYVGIGLTEEHIDRLRLGPMIVLPV